MPYRAFDGIETRCPKLGGPITFGYCRQENNGLPCSRALTCYQLLIPVDAYFQRRLTEETYRSVFEAEPVNKMVRLFQTVDKVRSGS